MMSGEVGLRVERGRKRGEKIKWRSPRRRRVRLPAPEVETRRGLVDDPLDVPELLHEGDVVGRVVDLRGHRDVEAVRVRRAVHFDTKGHLADYGRPLGVGGLELVEAGLGGGDVLCRTTLVRIGKREGQKNGRAATYHRC